MDDDKLYEGKLLVTNYAMAIKLPTCISTFIIAMISLSSSTIYAQTATPITNTTSVQNPEVIITYPNANQTLPTGTLTIYGKSSDKAATDCLYHHF
ncbi:MAG: hypothetical protein ACR2IS_13970 [Nitrososphaeraceae archaeon]